ncbi:MAG: 5'/3'-nucleotidase SurE [Coprothermobacterota bacterium]|nr:5'/3'-nucleotidase SurE [Coprothermobacterota bacterium]
MRFLLTNDDGVDSPGLMALAQAISELGDVAVVAPEKEWSGGGHSITIHKPLRIREREAPGERIRVWQCSGSPADCVVIGVFDLLPEPPILVISGINLGPNLGEDLTYSGTVSAAMEAYICDLPAFSISIASFHGPRWEVAAEVAQRLAKLLIGFPKRLLLNVNVPNCSLSELRGVALTRLGRRRYRERLTKGNDPFGRPYYWIAGEPEVEENGEGSDSQALEHGFVSITPFFLDLTDYTMLARLDPLRKELAQILLPS